MIGKKFIYFSKLENDHWGRKIFVDTPPAKTSKRELLIICEKIIILSFSLSRFRNGMKNEEKYCF